MRDGGQITGPSRTRMEGVRSKAAGFFRRFLAGARRGQLLYLGIGVADVALVVVVGSYSKTSNN